MAHRGHTVLPAGAVIRPAALLLPALLVNAGTFLWPVLQLASLAFRPTLPGGGIGPDWTVATWARLLSDTYYVGLIVHSVVVSMEITLLTLLAGYPLALAIHRAPANWRNPMMVLCIAPLLVSAVVRTYGWLLILSDRGVLPSLLRAVGVAPPRLVFNETGVVIGLVQILMPYMILSLLAGFGRLDANLESAAASLGASPWTRFRRIVLPLTLPGILLGCLLVFVLAVSSFVTPNLLGGGRVNLLATEIYEQAMVTLDWPLAAALSVVTLAVFSAALLLYGRLLRAIA